MLRRKAAAANKAKAPLTVASGTKLKNNKRPKAAKKSSQKKLAQSDIRLRGQTLEAAVFGGAVSDDEHVIGDAKEADGSEPHELIGDFNDNVSSAAESEDSDADGDDKNNDRDESISNTGVLSMRPAWQDDEDEDETIDLTSKPRTKKLRKTEDENEVDGSLYTSRLRSQFEQIHGRPSWANTEKSDSKDVDEDDNADFLRNSKKMLSSMKEKLPKGVLDVTAVRDVNFAAPSKAVVQALEFHPRIAAAMTAGLDKTLRLFQVDGKVNRLLQSVHFPTLPIYSAAFSNGGAEIILSGRRKFFYVYDLQSGSIRKVDEIQGRSEKSLEHMYVDPDSDMIAFTGRNGEIALVSNKTKQWAGTLKMNGAVNAISFLENKNKLLSSGRDGKVYLWDLRAQRCEHVFVDEGCISSTSLAVSKNDKYIACGSDTGIVNIYDESCLKVAHPTPLKAVGNLTTAVNNIKFHPDSQILGICSRSVKDGFRVVHIPSMTVFRNWPTGRTPLNYVNTFAFSPQGGYVSIGNDKGKSLLYRLNHYSQL